MKNKIIDKEKCKALFHDGQTIMVGSFLAKGCSKIVIDALVESNAKNLTIMCGDGGIAPKYDKNGNLIQDRLGIARLIHNNQVKTLYATHIGFNPEVGQKMNDGSLEVILVPQGTFSEVIRAGGAGLGGVITPTGVATLVEKDKRQTYRTITLTKKKYLIAKPLHADIAIIHGYIVDEIGNVYYEATSRNFNPMMATAADTVIVGADNIVKRGKINGNNIVTPGVLVDYILQEEN